MNSPLNQDNEAIGIYLIDSEKRANRLELSFDIQHGYHHANRFYTFPTIVHADAKKRHQKKDTGRQRRVRDGKSSKMVAQMGYSRLWIVYVEYSSAIAINRLIKIVCKWCRILQQWATALIRTLHSIDLLNESGTLAICVNVFPHFLDILGKSLFERMQSLSFNPRYSTALFIVY